MLERGPAVAVRMKITAQHSVKAKKFKQISFELVGKQTKNNPFFALYKPKMCKHFKHAIEGLSLLHLSQIKYMRTEKKFSNMIRMTKEWNSFHGRDNPNRSENPI